jgi:hypothetical protein
MNKNLILLSLLCVSISSYSQTNGNTTTAIPVPQGYKIKKVTVKSSYKISTLKNNITIENTNGFTSAFNRNGSTATIVNSDGTQSSITLTGNTATVKNSTGNSFNVAINGNVSIITNASGGVATVTNSGNTSTVVAEGTTSIVNNYGNISVAIYANGTAYAIFNYTDMLINDPSAKPVNGITINPEGGITAGFTFADNKPVVNTYSSTFTTTVTVPVTDTSANDSNGTVTYEPIGNNVSIAERALADYWARPAIEYALIIKDSATAINRFEIDLFSGSKKYKKATDLVCLSISTASSVGLSNAAYNYNQTLNRPLTFKGTVRSGKEEITIMDGTVNIKTDGNNLTIDYALKLANGKRITGRYNGNYQTANRINN